MECPALIPKVLIEEGVDSEVMLISESGLIGGIPASGGDFGAHYNPEAMLNQTDHFSFFDQGGLDVAFFGLSEVDRDGNVNTTNLNGKIAGVGGFPNISRQREAFGVRGLFHRRRIKMPSGGRKTGD